MTPVPASLDHRSGAPNRTFQDPRWKSATVALLLTAAGCLIATVIWKRLSAPWEFDESYNLQVIENLRDGYGYSSNGAVRGVGPWEFDPNISTGPSVLLPIWLLSYPLGTLAAARVAMLAFFAALLVMIRSFTGHGRRGWFVYALALLAGVSFIDAAYPMLVLGEIPATAFLVGVLIALRRRSFWVMGLLMGLTALAKLNYVTAALAIATVWIGSTLLTDATAWRTLPRQVARVAAGAIAPVLLFELYRMVSLGGLTGYRNNLSALRSFLEVQRLNHWSDAAGLLGNKVISLVGIMQPALVGALTLCVVTAPFLGRSPVSSDRERLQDSDVESLRMEMAFAATGASIIGTWLFLSGVPWLRQGAPGALLLSTALILTFARRSLPGLHHSEQWARTSSTAVIAAVAGLLCVVGVGHTIRNIDAISSTGMGPTRQEQRAVADLIERSGATGILSDGWFQNPQLQLLSGVPAASMPGADARPLLVVDAVKYWFSGEPGGLATAADRCDRVLYESDDFLVCWPLDGDDATE